MDLVDEQHVAALQTGQESGKIAGFVDHGPGGTFDINAHLFGKNIGQCGFAQSGRTGEQYMFHDVPPPLGRLDKEFQPFTGLLLSHEIAELGGTETYIQIFVGLVQPFFN